MSAYEHGARADWSTSDVKMPTRMRTGRVLQNLALFTRQLHVLVSTGTPVVNALDALQRQSRDERWRAVVGDVRRRVEEGEGLADAMREHPAFFDPMCCTLVAAGESTGDLPGMVRRLSALVQQRLVVRKSVAGALTYPALLLTIALSALIALLVVVLPRFGELFATLDVPLPPTTKVLMTIGTALRTWWWAFILAVVGLGVGGWAWGRSAGGRSTLHGLMLAFPGIGTIVRSLCTARIARVLGVLVEAKVPLFEALELTKHATGNVRYDRLLDHAADAVREGDDLSVAFADEFLVAPSVHEVLRSGERSGQVGTLLLSVADALDDDNSVSVRSLTSVLEPMILLLLGGLIGLVAVSLFLPLFDLAATTGGA